MGAEPKGSNPIQEKSYSFAIRIVRMYQHLSAERQASVLLRQVLRSGTSIGANVEEALGGISKKDFIAKMSIAYKEAVKQATGFGCFMTPITSTRMLLHPCMRIAKPCSACSSASFKPQGTRGNCSLLIPNR